ncbi:borealin-like isoform X2 [Ctenocephalides felis]|uniref:borealin-like isoform X2 n=1 Tax=Ctenocephalides felis TaxID=7515 RepID=UPI000E6E5237|nr:borealin-like isoform X2 [Ctenocephalides felis]
MVVKEYEMFKQEVAMKLKEVNSNADKLLFKALSLLKMQQAQASSKPLTQLIKEAEVAEQSKIDMSQNNKKRKMSSDDEEASRLKIAKIAGTTKKQVNITHLTPSRMGPKSILSKSRFKTPMRNKTINKSTYGMITPKVTKNQTLMLMRRPAQGEMAMSLAGSPLLVSSVVGEELANVNIPMPDGKHLALFPTQLGKIDPEDLPKFDADTKKQLQMLAENLSKICKMCK